MKDSATSPTTPITLFKPLAVQTHKKIRSDKHVATMVFVAAMMFCQSPAFAWQVRPVSEERVLQTDPQEQYTDPRNLVEMRTDPEGWTQPGPPRSANLQNRVAFANRPNTVSSEPTGAATRIQLLERAIRTADASKRQDLINQLDQLYLDRAHSRLALNNGSERSAGSFPLVSYQPGSQPVTTSQQFDFSGQTVAGSAKDIEQLSILEGTINHQPLIQVRVRVVDVDRIDTLAAASVLDYIASDPAGAANSFIQGNNINNDQVNGSSATRFDVGGLINLDDTGTAIGAGQGMLLNLTDTKLNSIIRLLATEMNGDLVTAPEVVTLNGQNVEFVAGDKIPFLLGQNVITGDTNSIQQFFYKHVGTYISVTPRIVNWGPNYKGRGKVPWGRYVHFDYLDIRDPQQLWTEIAQYPDLIKKSPILADLYVNHVIGNKPFTGAQWKSVIDGFNQTIGQIIIGFDAQGQPIEQRISRKYLASLFHNSLTQQCCDGCNWEPSDCTIDLSLVVRLSDAGLTDVDTGSSLTETDVRAIANIVQVKNGHGVVIGGLISESDQESLTKVPVLGDIPVIAPIFRSKVKQRQKLETLIFVEARVLDSDPTVARFQSYENLTLSQPYVQGTFLENPLEYGMFRTGFGNYLPPKSSHEKIYWERMGRKIRKAYTKSDDIFN